MAEALTARACAQCGSSLQCMRPHAIYCGRACKSRACEARLRTGQPGERERNHRRYASESVRRRETARRYYWAHRDTYLVASREWRRANPERRQLQGANRRARVRGVGYLPITERDWHRALVRAAGRCYYCGRLGRLVVDHVVPLARGGRHALANVVPACADCNASKGARLLAEWRHRGR